MCLFKWVEKKVLIPEQGTTSFPAAVLTGRGILKRPHAWFGSSEQNNQLHSESHLPKCD